MPRSVASGTGREGPRFFGSATRSRRCALEALGPIRPLPNRSMHFHSARHSNTPRPGRSRKCCAHPARCKFRAKPRIPAVKRESSRFGCAVSVLPYVLSQATPGRSFRRRIAVRNAFRCPGRGCRPSNTRHWCFVSVRRSFIIGTFRPGFKGPLGVFQGHSSSMRWIRDNSLLVHYLPRTCRCSGQQPSISS
jgi:hypothetical protein